MENFETTISEAIIVEQSFLEFEEFKSQIPLLNLKLKVIGSEKYTKNKSLYPAEEIKKSFQTLVNKPINVNHEHDYIIGVITEAYLENKRKNVDLMAKGIVWEYRFPEESSKIKDLIRVSKKIDVSLEALPNYVECPTCGEIYEYLKYRLGSGCNHLQKTNKRILRDIEFIGVSILFPPKEPAYDDARAELLSVNFDISKLSPSALKNLSSRELRKLLQEVKKHNERK